MVSKVFEKLINIKLVNHLETCNILMISSMLSGLLELLTVLSDRIARAFDQSRATRIVAFDILKILSIQGLACWSFFINLSLMEFQVKYLP